jgi:hypothetical protein
MPDFPGCAATRGAIAWPSRVSSVSTSAVETLRPSRVGKVLHPAANVSSSIKQGTALNSLIGIRC